MKKRTYFKLRINIPDLDEYFPKREPCNGEYEAEIVINENNVQEIILKIFFNHKEYLADKIMWWNTKNDTNLLSQFKVTEIIQPDNLIDVDFSNYSTIGMTRSSDFIENGIHYFTIKLNGVIKVFNNKEQGSSEFYLNNQAFQLIESNYRYNINFPWFDELFELKATSDVKEYIQFNRIKFKPEHNFYNSSQLEENEIKIKKEPKLSVKYSSLNEQEIKNNIQLICSLYSFYSKQKIDYFFSRIYTDNNLYLEFRHIDNFHVKNPHGFFRFDFYNNPLNLIININSNHLIENFEFVTNIIDRFNYALSTEGESRFMILYNILEQVRNQYILNKKIEQEKAGENPNLKKVVEEYNFTRSKTQTDKFIKKNLERIKEIISEEHKELFQSEVGHKIFPIKVLSMINQFKSLFTFLEVNPKEFELDFKKLKSLRDSIFHGRPILDDKKFLNDVNYFKRLPKFTGIVLLKYFGINDLKEITKIK